MTKLMFTESCKHRLFLYGKFFISIRKKAFCCLKFYHLRFCTKFIIVRVIITASPIPLETADNLNISGRLFSPFTEIKVFCKVKTDISASIKLMFRKSFISKSSDFLDFFKLIEAIIVLNVVYVAIDIAGIILIETFFLSITISVMGIISAEFIIIRIIETIV